MNPFIEALIKDLSPNSQRHVVFLLEKLRTLDEVELHGTNNAISQMELIEIYEFFKDRDYSVRYSYDSNRNSMISIRKISENSSSKFIKFIQKLWKRK